MRQADVRVLPVLLLTFVGLAAAAPKEVKVNCSQGKSINDALSKLDSDSKDYIVSVSGTCNENVIVADFQGNSLVLQGDPTATINGVPNNPFGVPVVQLANSRQIVIQNLTINVTGALPTGNQAALSVTICSNCNVRNLIVNTPRSGITFAYSQGSIVTSTVNFNGTGGGGISIGASSDVSMGGVQLFGPGGPLSPGSFGLLVDQSSVGRLTPAAPSTGVTISGFGTGIMVHNNSFLYASTVCSSAACGNITNNTQGIRMLSSRMFVNGLNVTGNPNAGIFMGTGSTAEILGPFTISNATNGIGLAVSHNSHAALLANGPGITISGNFGPAVSVGTLSSVRFDIPGITTVNGPVKCDALSAITGTSAVGGTPVYTCANVNPISTPLP